MTAGVVEHTAEDLEVWRAQVLDSVHATMEDLVEREDMGALSPAEANALATVRGIDFLLS